mmetsp:Transcript_16835/g.50276  ORF Transcript_16835/g.50276 Transcript_16835/m.50276 type:complete len:254 (-) Transcript_16835:671-1432(-)
MNHHLLQLPAGWVVLAAGGRKAGAVLLQCPQVVHPLHIVRSPVGDVAELIAGAVDLLAVEAQDHHRIRLQQLDLHQLHVTGVQQRRIRHQPLRLLCGNDGGEALRHLGCAMLLQGRCVPHQIRSHHRRHVRSDLREEAGHVEVGIPLVDFPVCPCHLSLGENRIRHVLHTVHQRRVGRLPTLPQVIRRLPTPHRRRAAHAAEALEQRMVRIAPRKCVPPLLPQAFRLFHHHDSRGATTSFLRLPETFVSSPGG